MELLPQMILLLLLLLLLLLSSPPSSPLCRVFILIYLTQTVSLGNTVLQLFCCYYSWCLYVSSVSVLNLLYFYISTFRSMCAVPNMAVFCSSLTSCFPGMLLTYFLLLLLLLETFAVYLLLPAWNITYLLYNKVEFSL